ncbi:MAG TPA: hypothetical protein VK427_02045, partial [Kofleriaceae bacterium]|nr:hypothetical protein [Kofleriaceae bacterium]
MKPRIKHALDRLADAAWFRQESARAPRVQAHLAATAAALGYPLSHFTEGSPSPTFQITVEVGIVGLEVSVIFFGYVLANVFEVVHHVNIPDVPIQDMNRGAVLACELEDPPTKTAELVERVLSDVFVGLGWERISRAEGRERIAGFVRDVYVGSALA